MRVSVVIPAYNEEKHLEKCLDSLMDQEEKPLEIIVVDNNSNDRTAEIARQYQGVKVIPEKKQGTIFARNTGFDAAKGEIIARCDADTILPGNFVKRISEDFSRDDRMVALSMPITFYDMPVVKWFRYLYYPYMIIPRIIVGHFILAGPGMAVRKTGWEKVRKELCTDGKMVHEDVDVSLHLKKFGNISHDPKIMVKASGRRPMNKPGSFFIEYTIRFFRMLDSHRT